MQQLNKAWIALIVIGVGMLVFTIGFQVYQSINGGNDTFEALINELPNKTLINQKLEDHLTSADDYGQ